MNINIPNYYNISQDDFDKLKTLESFEITCQYCFNNFKTNKKNILKGLKDRNSYVKFCSAKCSNGFKSSQNRQEVNCTECSKTISKTKAELKKSNNHFCSRSCAATYNNKHFIKRELTRVCIQCTETVFTYRHTRCEKHHNMFKQNRYINKTIGEYRSKLSVSGKHPSWVHSHIRLFAKSWNKDLIKLPCAKCEYARHVELAHIKGISTYPDTTLLSVVNSKTNLIQLCPTCHWEFDNGYREEFKDILNDLGKIYSEE